MWYVFPQLAGLGHSGVTKLFSIRDLTEAADYLRHPVLGSRLVEISRELLHLDTSDPVAVFGSVDAYKLRSCMTLFESVESGEAVFAEVLEKYCMGIRDDLTLRLLGKTPL